MPSTSAPAASPDLYLLLERIKPLIDDTIERLRGSKFREDPIGGRRYSRATSIVSSAYKRHGQILERALLERLKDCPRLQVWQEDEFKLSQESLRELQVHARMEKCLSLRLPYGERERTIPVDLIVFNTTTRSLRSYNVKRGNGSYDAGKRRIIFDDLLRTNMLLADYGEKAGFRAETTSAHIIFYYGLRSIPQPISLIAADLDEHFAFPVVEGVEFVNDYFRGKLHDLIEEE